MEENFCVVINCLKFVIFTMCFCYFFTSLLSMSLLILLFVLYLLILFFIYMISLKAPDTSAVDKVIGFSEFEKKVIAHRACGMDAPENSLMALKNITEAGIRKVEFDVMLTADDIPVIFHDDSLQRMANDQRHLRDLTYEELKTINICRYSKTRRTERIPTLVEYVEWCMAHKISMLIDLKDRKLVHHIVKLFRTYPQLHECALVTSFDPWLIYRIRKADNRIIGCLAWRWYYYSHGECNILSGPKHPYTTNYCYYRLNLLKNIVHEWLLYNFLYYILGLSAVLIHKENISRLEICNWWNRGIKIMAWTVNDLNEKLAFDVFWNIPYLTDTTKFRMIQD